MAVLMVASRAYNKAARKVEMKVEKMVDLKDGDLDKWMAAKTVASRVYQMVSE